MLQRCLGMALIVLGWAAFSSPVLAAEQSISDTITLTGVVLPMRYIYLDKQGDIQQVVGNTSQNLTPAVLDYQHQLVPLTSKIDRQYQKLLWENGGILQAGQTYLPDKYDPYVIFARWVTTNPYFSQKII